MSSFTDYTEAQVLNHIFGSATFTKPANRFLGLFTTATTDAAGGTEVTGGSYARINIGNLTVSGTAPTLATNAAAIEFVAATAGWGALTHVAIFDALTAGNMLAHGPLTTGRTINSGDVFRIPIGDLDVTLD